MKYCSLLIAFLLLFFITNAQTTTWIGSTNGSWTDANNWDNGVPTSASNIVFDGAAPALTAGVINIADVSQSNMFGSFTSLVITNNATVNLSSASATYFYFTNSILINTGSRLNIGGTTSTRFEIGTTGFSSLIDINGTLDVQGQGISSNPTTFFPTTITFGTPSVVTTIRGTVILSGLNARFTPNANTPLFESGSQLIVTRNGGACPKANFKDGSLISIRGVTNSPSSFNSSAVYDGVIEWNCPGQTVSGSSAILLPSASFNYFDSLVIINTGAAGTTARLTTNPSGYYIKNLVMNGGTLEFGSPTGSGSYNCKLDNITQNGGTLIGNAAGVPGFDNAFEPDTINVTGNFIQNAGVFDFSNRTPVNSTPDATCVLQVAGNMHIGGTVRLSQAATAPDCALIFNGSGTQDFDVPGFYLNKIKTVLNSTSIISGISLTGNVTLPDSLVFLLGYILLNDFDLINPLPVLPVNNPFQTHVVTNGAGFFVQKNVGTTPIGIPVGASVNTINPLVLGLFAGTLDIATKVEAGINPAITFPDKAIDRTWQIKPLGTMPSNLAISFGYSNLSPIPSDGNANFSYTSNNEVGLYAGGNWQVITLPGGIAPSGTNPYAVSHVILNSLLAPNVASPLVISNVNSVVPVANLINLSVFKSGSYGLLEWTTEELTGSMIRFEVLRSSNGRDFINIGTVDAQINSNEYTFTDINLLAGINYYRIKVVDGTGRYKHSQVVALVNKTSGIVITSIIPAIVNNSATFIISSAAQSSVAIHITDMLCRVMMQTNTKLNAGSNQVTIDCSRLPAGTYQITGLSNGEKTNVVRFVKQ
jgi:urease beta subunit